MSDWDDWKKNAEAQFVSKKFLSEEKVKEQKAIKRPMTDDERKMIATLNQCSLRTGTFHKRIMRDFVAMSENNLEISERMAWTLRGLYWTYRRQHKDTGAVKPEGWQ